MDNNIFSSINSLIAILILLLIIAAVVLVVRAVMAPRVEPPRSEPPIVQQAPATSGLEPGWYPDQNDSNLTRYFDGRKWTSRTQPRT
jgi:Protein of unknown function (DUF2510)